MKSRFLAILLVMGLVCTFSVRAADDKGAKSDKPAVDKTDGGKLNPTDTVDNLAAEQARLKMEFENFKQQLLRLADRLGQSTDQGNRDKAKILRLDIDKANESGTDIKFDKLVNLLKGAAKDVSIDDLETIRTQNEDLSKDIRAIIAILMTDNRDAELRRQREELEKKIRELKIIISKEERIGDKARIGKTEGKELGKAQEGVTADTRKLIGQVKGSGKEGKPGDAKGEGKPGDNKGEGKNDAKDAKGDPKKGDGKDGMGGEGKKADTKDGKDGMGPDAKKGEGKQGDPGKNGESKPSDSKSGQPGQKSDGKGKGDGKGEGKPADSTSGGQPSDSKGGGKGSQSQGGQGSGKGGGKGNKNNDDKQQPPQDTPQKKKIEEGITEQEKAEKDLPENQKKGADDVDSAKKKLEEVLKKWEELLKQLREEEVERILAQLQAQCEKMRQLQIQVRDGTILVDRAITENADKKPTRAEDQKSLELADREQEIINLANKAIGILRDEGSAVAFPEVFTQVRDDMVNVAARLRKTDVGSLTVTIENDIIATLGEMIEALKKARQENGKQPPSPGKPGSPGTQKLIELLAELKMLRSMQIRVNSRTEVYSKEYEGEQAPAILEAKSPAEKDKAEMLHRELKELSVRQQKIMDVANNIAKEKNK